MVRLDAVFHRTWSAWRSERKQSGKAARSVPSVPAHSNRQRNQGCRVREPKPRDRREPGFGPGHWVGPAHRDHGLLSGQPLACASQRATWQHGRDPAPARAQHLPPGKSRMLSAIVRLDAFAFLKRYQSLRNYTYLHLFLRKAEYHVI